MDGSIITYTGRRFYPLDPDPADVDPVDIAHATAMQCRYTGHVRRFYSVATHSVLVHDYLQTQGEDQETCLWGLLHDGSEAYLLDLAAPLKHHPEGFGERFQEVEHEIEEAIAMRFGLTMPIPDAVKAVDLNLRTNEMNELLPPVNWESWGDPLPITIPDWTPVEAKAQMIWRMVDYGIVRRDSRGNYHASDINSDAFNRFYVETFA
jgi:hypothetical protein